MLELMNPIALEVGEARRREVAEETMRAVRASDNRPRQPAASALMFLAQQVGSQDAAPQRETSRKAAPSPKGELPKGELPKMQPQTDCV